MVLRLTFKPALVPTVLSLDWRKSPGCGWSRGSQNLEPKVKEGKKSK